MPALTRLGRQPGEFAGLDCHADGVEDRPDLLVTGGVAREA